MGRVVSGPVAIISVPPLSLSVQYAVIVAIFVVLEVASAILGFVFRDELVSWFPW